jgi:Kef-type K+ transport system membrane component KefB
MFWHCTERKSEVMQGNAFCDIAAILGLTTLLGAVWQTLRQPLLMMFLTAGILAGPSCCGIEVYDRYEF